MFGILLSAHVNGDNTGFVRCCHFGFRILSIANGCAIRSNCFNHDSVSTDTSLME